ncbi:MAG: 50S ribosomal protein L4 [bacterium]
MPNVNVYDMAGQVVGSVELPASVFGIEPNEAVLHMAVRNHLANLRQGTQSALTKAEVSGGGAKPYRQKGTGHARQGSTRNPHYTHGGVAFAPKPRTYTFSVNKKVRKLAIRSALSQKAVEENVVVVNAISCAEPKTKAFKGFLNAVGAEKKALVITAGVDANVVKSARNIPGVATTPANNVNAYAVLNADKLVIAQDALSTLEEVYA